MIVSRYFSTIPDGNPVPNGVTVELRAHADGSLIDTESTQGGWVTFVLDGNPVGPHYLKCQYNDEVHVVSSMATGISGVSDLGNLPLLAQAFGDGYVEGILGELAVTAPGSAMTVQVAGGAAYSRGVLYDQRSTRTLSLDAPGGQPRIDRIVIEVVPPGGPAMQEGRSRLTIKKGTPSAAPVAPSLTQTSNLYEMVIADIQVNPGVAALTQDVVTDRRVVMTPYIPTGAIATAKIADGGITTPKLANNAVTATKIPDGEITTAKIADGAVTGVKIGAGQITSSHIVDDTIVESDLSPSVRNKLNATPGEIGTGGIANGAVTTAKIADGAVTGAKIGTGAVTKAMVGLSNVPNTDATSRSNHTGEQAIATVTGLQGVLDGKAASSHTHSASAITSGTIDLARIPLVSFPFARASHSVASTVSTSGTGELATGTSPISRKLPLVPGTWRLAIDVSGLMWRSVDSGHFVITVAVGYYNASVEFVSLWSTNAQVAHGVGSWPAKNAAQRYVAAFDELFDLSTTQSQGAIVAYFRGNDTAGTTYMGNAAISGVLQRLS